MTVPAIIPPGASVLVTGGTGFIGSHCVASLLTHGYVVKVAVRSEAKFQALVSHFGSSNLSCVVVKDITSTTELVPAVKNCDAIFHLASPYTYNVTDYENELMVPAVRGTTAIMEAAAAEPRVKKIVLASSFAAIFDASKGLQPEKVYTEKDFSPLTWNDGVNAPDASVAYRASKIVAERAAWDFIAKNTPNFSLTVICPPMVYGPLVTTSLLGSIDDLNFSNLVVWLIATTKNAIPPTKGPVWVDVRDLAKAFTATLTSSQSHNQRYLVSAGDYDNQEIADILRDNFNGTIPLGSPGQRLLGTHFTTDSTKAVNHLNCSFTSLKTSVLDLCKQLSQL